ncbi:hypothetical protein HII31_10702 [Pseudocercospora fuligena]|uniref:BTB domain-containing protein n=1 Tax=Pseudocercospora fuligena TaxID=685502 RepID=A0A8H6RC22_9PEZI|nr:hypothetical protein HII31_10702 [Pseudocercospora fuligena]
MSPAGAPPAKRMKYSGDFVTIRVGIGAAQETLPIHEHMIKEKSQFFRAAFDRKWKEGQSREVELPEDDPNVVHDYLDWLYGGSVQSAPMSKSFSYSPLVKRYLFGEKVLDDSFCNAVMRAICEKCDHHDEDGKRRFPGPQARKLIYENTLPGSLTRQFVVFVTTESGSVEWLHGSIDHPDFLLELAKALLASKPQAASTSTLLPQVDRWMKIGG